MLSALSSRSGSSLIMEMSRIEGFRDLQPSCGTGSSRVLVSNLGPVKDMMIAPVGAVRIMDKTHSVRVVSAYRRASGSLRLISSRVTGPRAAWTVALAMHAKAMKIFSLRLKREPIPTITVAKILRTIPVTRHAMHRYTVPLSNSSILIWVPVTVNRIGSKIIQKISNDIVTGFWK